MVDNGEDRVLLSYVWESCDKVHSDLLKGEGVVWTCDTIEGNSGPVGEILVLLAGCASCNIISDPGFHPFPL